MTAESKLKKIQKILKNYKKEIDDACDNDREVTLGGNGINCWEASSTLKPLAGEINAVIDAK